MLQFVTTEEWFLLERFSSMLDQKAVVPTNHPKCGVLDRRCRCRGKAKARVQHVLTTIAMNIERLSRQPPSDEPSPVRPPTTFQDVLDQQGIPRLRSCREVGG
ncbi:hypothetical protein GCM10009799_51020 [Nocardiopsis rhodophaea]|uniref:Transposase n=1 Tax=Nocardiopsis rhodophaea TaxID=280238 RepID=A0ABP5F9A8_9ACTN